MIQRVLTDDRGGADPSARMSRNSDSVSGAPRTGNQRWRFLQVDPVDRYSWWTWVGLVSAVMLVALAVAGLPPIDLRGPLHDLGVMCPLCGGTRSVYLTLHGHLGAALQYNPAAPLVPLGAAAVLARAVVGRISGRWVTPVAPRRVALICFLLVALIALEVNQQLNADLLSSRWPA